MLRVKKGFYLIAVLYFLTGSFSMGVYAGESSEKRVKNNHTVKTDGQGHTPDEKQPRVAFDSTTFDAGEVWQGSEVTHDFTVRNIGNAALTITRLKSG